MAILIDAGVIIEAETGRFDLARWLDSRPEDEFMLAAITIAELWHGAERATGSHRANRELFLERLFAMFEVVPYTDLTGFEHARIWARLESGGKMISPHDLILAATAIQIGSAVATFNTRHFSIVPDLKVISP
jgi:tRNA(fMet)-specific endonuclease VapC